MLFRSKVQPTITRLLAHYEISQLKINYELHTMRVCSKKCVNLIYSHQPFNMTNEVRPLTIFIILTSAALINAVRKFDLILTDIKCNVRSDYIGGLSCIVNKTQPTNPSIYVYGQLQKEIRDLRLDFSIDLIHREGDTITFFKTQNIDGCTFASINATLPMLKMFADLILKYGDWPSHCPIPVGYEFKAVNAVLDPDYLPTFVPNVDFCGKIIIYDKKLTIWDVEIYGTVSHKRNNKGNPKA